MDTEAGPFRTLGRVVLPFVLLNLLALLAYRLLFIATYVAPEGREDIVKVLLSGARLDLALLGGTLALLALLSLLRLRISLRGAVVICLVVTVVNLLLCTVNFLFYGERGEPLGRLLVANLTSPDVLLSEVTRFAGAHPWTAALSIAFLLGGIWSLVRLVRRVPRRSWSHLESPKRLLIVVVFGALCFVPILEPIEETGDRIVDGWTVDIASARHYQRFDDYAVHQAIPNPLHEILFSRVPQALSSLPPPRLAPEESLAVLQAALPGEPVDSDYPLLRRVRSTSDLGLENVLIVQVEGLSGSIVERDVDGRAVMPFLADLTKRSLYFPNTVHTFPTTYGGLHCTTASIPRTNSCVTRGRFTYEELQGYFGSLPRLLKGLAACRSFYGSRQSAEDVRAYMGNQGYVTTNHRQLGATLEGTRPHEEIESELGIWDGPTFEEVAKALRRGPHPTVMHVMTSSTHSPWALPPSKPALFEDKVLSGFHYLDDCLRQLFEDLAEEPGLLDKTLVIITADHVSFGYGRNDLNWARIPLLFCNPRLAGDDRVRRDARWATLTDIVPTVLALFGGEHEYAGIGRNLLEPDLPFGALFSNAEEVFYLKDDRLLRWRFSTDSVGIYAAEESGWGREELSSKDGERADALKHEFFGLYEGTRTAASEGRVYPRRP